LQNDFEESVRKRIFDGKIFEETSQVQEKNSDGKVSRKKMKLIRRGSKKKLLEKFAS